MHLRRLFARVVLAVFCGSLVPDLAMAEVQPLTEARLQPSLQPTTLRVFEPHERKEIEFRGYDLKAVLDHTFGPRWRDSEVVIFVCADGYNSSVPTAKLASQTSVLATERLDQKGFSLNKHGQGETAVALAPFFLVWDNLQTQYELEDGTFWPYQVVGIELTSLAEKFPHMVPPSSSSEEVRRGFSLFQQHCLSCHKVNGDGGDKGGELNLPVSAFEKQSRQDLHAWIDNPAPGMPPFNKNVKDRDAAIDAIISYLGAMSEKKMPAPSK
jgi:mono/diheme cytochrome c family protein